jgi:hypothetical protein
MPEENISEKREDEKNDDWNPSFAAEPHQLRNKKDTDDHPSATVKYRIIDEEKTGNKEQIENYFQLGRQQTTCKMMETLSIQRPSEVMGQQ